MRKTLLRLTCLLAATGLQAFEYQVQFENDQVCIAQVKILPHEEIDLHRDVCSHVVVALKGGTITRLEEDGGAVDIEFPEGVAVFRPMDPENQFHRSVNNSDTPIELILIQLKNSLDNSEQ